ncbi:hypothetical protein BDD43_1833 [Mucilaginibacter gracilis]|uniref:Uncharacterized protein n=1 Tax=Mucilaginibacter gracilis TaxID=423350 RepID=A0A495IYV3_9SPHI|nr:hypothetical protein [Mucilaginibacter gracilis]RKR81683.1 hypothetical protein BDD43_1833 [Mucilaginibacter gracilis]
MSTREHANDTRHYLMLTVAIIIGILGVYIRFWGPESFMLTSISNVVLVIGILIALKTVFTIMK